MQESNQEADPETPHLPCKGLCMVLGFILKMIGSYYALENPFYFEIHHTFLSKGAGLMIILTYLKYNSEGSVEDKLER